MLEPLEKFNRKQNHDIIIDAFAKAFADEEDLGDLVNSLDHHSDGEKNRKAAYTRYALPVFTRLGENSEKMIIDFLTNPKSHYVSYGKDKRYFFINKAATVLAGTHVELNPSAVSADGLMNRLKTMLLNWNEIECDSRQGKDYPNPRNFLFPKAGMCLTFLKYHFDQPGVKTFLYDLFCGKFNTRFDCGENAYRRHMDVCRQFLEFNDNIFDIAAQDFFRENKFTYEFFEKVGRLYPRFIKTGRLHDDRVLSDLSDGIDKSFLKKYREYSERLLLQLIDELPGSAQLTDDIMGYMGLPGLKWVEQGLCVIDKLGLKAKDLRDNYENFLGKVISTLVGKNVLAAGEQQSDAIQLLKQFRQATLLLALPYATSVREFILMALGWEDLIPIQRILFRIAGGDPLTDQRLDDVYNSHDPDSGVVDRAGILREIEHIDDARLNKYTKALQSSSLEIKNTLMLFNAIRGLNRDKIETKLKRHGQAAIKAYGLYSIESQDDLQKRYLKFKAMHKEAAQYGSQRQANTQAAVLAGLKNLAKTAGFADEIRMEWRLEADIAGNMIPFNQQNEVENWSVQLVLEGITPKIEIRSKTKILKSVPPQVRKSDIYGAMHQAQDAIRAQARRFRGTIENMMCNGEKIKRSELKILAKLPVVNGILKQLILKSGEKFGLFTGDVNKLIGLDGKRVSISGDLQIAHVYHLFKSDILHHWQEFIVRQRLVQPFKQAFRELYVVTPAEIEAVDRSSRFAGHVVDSAITSRLLQSRGWGQFGGDVVEVFKTFANQDFTAEIGFPDSRHYLAGEPEVTIDEVCFWRKRKRIPLADIEPITFSEVMRDVDLIASVAQVSDEDERWSSEMAESRAQLIRTLISEIGLRNIKCEGHFAYITGKLANYRVHLGSGVIHIEPGNYLCVVPSQEDSKKNIYLPFSDKDKKMAEIISKIFLLNNDESIADTTILEQIKQHQNN